MEVGNYRTVPTVTGILMYVELQLFLLTPRPVWEMLDELPSVVDRSSKGKSAGGRNPLLYFSITSRES